MYIQLIKSSAIGNQLNLHFFPLPGGGERNGEETESSNPLITNSSILKLSRSPQPSVNSLAYRTTLFTLEIPRVLEGICQKMGRRPKVWYLIKIHNITLTITGTKRDYLFEKQLFLGHVDAQFVTKSRIKFGISAFILCISRITLIFLTYSALHIGTLII